MARPLRLPFRNSGRPVSSSGVGTRGRIDPEFRPGLRGTIEEKTVKSTLRLAGRKLSGLFFRGLAITLTAALLYWLLAITEHFLGDLIRSVFPGLEYWPGLGTLAAVAIVFAAGMLMNVWVTRQLMLLPDRLLDRIPLVKTVYGGLRDIAMFLSRKGANAGFKKVVAVRAAAEMRLIGFVTVEDFATLSGGKDGPAPVGVYLPMGYQIGGFTVFVPQSALEPLDRSVEDAMRFVLTAGLSGGKARPA
jgi:uncharacterized membrane protein